MAWLLLASAAAALTSPVDAQPVYSDPALWLCAPGRDDACAGSIDASAVDADGTVRVEPSPPADPRANADCFYVYPTISSQPRELSDRTAGPGERGTALTQIARFRTRCRIFAPLYRQVTFSALRRAAATKTPPSYETSYADIAAAWRHYLVHENRGRPFVLIGYSEGAILGKMLLSREIEGRPIASHMLSAMLIGTTIETPADGRPGGELRTPPCRKAADTGCLIGFSTFRSTAPPPPDSHFGRTTTPGMTAVCVSPTALRRVRYASPYLLRVPTGLGTAEAIDWAPSHPIATRFVTLPKSVSLNCVQQEGVGYLSESIDTPGPSRTSDIGGDFRVGTQALPQWGLHLIDMNVAQGDLVALVGTETAAFRARR